MERLVVCIMGQNCEKFIGMCLESVKDTDAIVYCDGGSEDKTFNIIGDFTRENSRYQDMVIKNPYNQEDKQMNGKQRNFYLDYLKKNYPGWFALCLDADEVVDDFSKLREWINKYGRVLENGYPAINVKMRHFHGDLGREDATVAEHAVLNRLFYVKDGLWYPEVEHPVLQYNNEPAPEGYICRDVTIWHLAHIQHCFEIKKRYEKNLKHSNIHSKEFLDNWYLAHLTNRYPTSPVNPLDIPEVIWKNFNIDKDMFYFANRNVEAKHFVMAKQWSEIIDEHSGVVEFGCGKGPFGFAFNVLGIPYEGIEISKFAVNNSFVPIHLGNILTTNQFKSNLVICFDVLEHLEYEDLDIALKNMNECTFDKVLISVPVIGDPNLENDPTHKIRETKDWWIEKISKHFDIKETPKDWLFAEQIIIGKKKHE